MVADELDLRDELARYALNADVPKSASKILLSHKVWELIIAEYGHKFSGITLLELAPP